MSRIENDFAKIISSPNNTKWRELKNVAEAYGCKAKPGAKHWKLYHELRPRPLTIPVHSGKVKTIYVKQVISLIKEIIGEEEDNNE